MPIMEKSHGKEHGNDMEDGDYIMGTGVSEKWVTILRNIKGFPICGESPPSKDIQQGLHRDRSGNWKTQWKLLCYLASRDVNKPRQ